MTPIIKQPYRCGSLCGQCLVLKSDKNPWLIIQVKNEDLLWELYCRRWLVTTHENGRSLLLESLDSTLDATSINCPFWPTTPETAVTDTLRLNEQFKQELQK